MLDLILKLIDRCVQLVRERQQTNQKLVSDFLTPILNDFDAVHESYLSTFKQYRNLIMDGSKAFSVEHPVFDKIREDSIFTLGIRARLYDLAELPLPNELGDLLSSVRNYLYGGFNDIARELGPGNTEIDTKPERVNIRNPEIFMAIYGKRYKLFLNHPPENFIRLQAFNNLYCIASEDIPQDKKIVLAGEVIDNVVVSFQRRYASVHGAANELRLRLLG